MRLTELHPRLVHHTEIGWQEVDSFDEADGVIFDCPACAGDHPILVWSSKAPPGLAADMDGKRWTMTGTGLHDLTLSPSVLLLSGCRWHGVVTSGEVTTV